MTWAFGPQGGPPRRRGVVLELTCCEERFVPDGSGATPPDGWDAGQQPGQQAYALNLQAGDLVYVGQVNGQVQLVNLDASGRMWLLSVAAESGQFTAVLLNYDGSYDPGAGHPVQSNFAPSPDHWNMVWNPDQGTWSTAAPGTVFPAAVSGYTSCEWNYVLLAATQAPPPVGPPTAPPPGGVTITVNPGGSIQIVAPPGTTVTITPAPGGGTTIQVGGRPPVAVNPPSGTPELPETPPEANTLMIGERPPPPIDWGLPTAPRGPWYNWWD
jgi:hypothetical protein